MEESDRTNIQEADEQLARDVQLALDLQERENQLAERDEERHRRRRQGSHERPGYDDNGQSGYPMHDWNRLDHMLFVTCEVEGRLVEMLVDSGASSSCISYSMVHYLGLQQYFNPNVRGEATGAGTAQIYGLLENVSCQIGHVEFRLFFLVLDTQRPYLILGLDQMRRFKCVIDLDRNHLIFGGRDGVSAPFLDRELAAAAALRPLPVPLQTPRFTSATVPVGQPPLGAASPSPVGRLASLFGRR